MEVGDYTLHQPDYESDFFKKEDSSDFDFTLDSSFKVDSDFDTERHGSQQLTEEDDSKTDDNNNNKEVNCMENNNSNDSNHSDSSEQHKLPIKPPNTIKYHSNPIQLSSVKEKKRKQSTKTKRANPSNSTETEGVPKRRKSKQQSNNNGNEENKAERKGNDGDESECTDEEVKRISKNFTNTVCKRKLGIGKKLRLLEEKFGVSYFLLIKDRKKSSCATYSSGAFKGIFDYKKVVHDGNRNSVSHSTNEEEEEEEEEGETESDEKDTSFTLHDFINEFLAQSDYKEKSYKELAIDSIKNGKNSPKTSEERKITPNGLKTNREKKDNKL